MKFKRIATGVLALVISLFAFVPQALAAEPKNETVYAALNSDGSVDNIYVINQLLGEYADYGEYSEIKNLSTTSTPVIEGDKITFPDERVEGGLYYQGTMQGQLPFVFEITFYMDGVQTAAEELAGASGFLKMNIKGRVNEASDERVRKGYMAQLSLALDQDKASDIVSEGATIVAAGKTMNVSYVILPGKSAEYSLTANIRDFEMEGISIILLKGSISGMEDTISETEDGFDDMLSGAEDMVDGTNELKDGMSSLTDGIKSLSNGMSKLSSSGGDILSGMKEYSSGLKDYTDGVSGMASASSGIGQGLDALSSNASDVASGISNINNGLGGLYSSSADLRALAHSLLSSPDPSVQALAQGTLQTLDSVNTLSSGLDDASQGVSDFASGVQEAASGYQDFDSGLSALSAGGSQLKAGYDEMTAGFSSYHAGIKSSASGARKIYNSIKDLPDDIQKLIDGQIEFKDGISTAKDELIGQTENFIADDSPAVSFASPDKNQPKSVQYILSTPSITIPEPTEAVQTEEKNEDFFTRLADLFR